jgi:hypothetical protein
MKHGLEFKNLLKNKVNLDDSRLELLDQRVESVFKVLKADPGVGSYVKDKIPQGSWAHCTIIRPAAGQEFDADFLVRMEEVDGWQDTPVEYLKYLRGVLAAHGTYKDMPLRRKCRCVRLGYAGDCHLDIVPFVERADGTKWIVNGDEDKWEPTNPQGYTDWINGKDKDAKGNLRKVVRLAKFLRDREGAFGGTKSIILTTLLGLQVESWKTAVQPGCYDDIPSTLLRVITDLDVWLQTTIDRPSVADPSAPTTTFDHRWDDDIHEKLKESVHLYRGLIEAAFYEEDEATSRQLWQAIFGDGFDRPDEDDKPGRFGVVPPAPGRSGRGG